MNIDDEDDSEIRKWGSQWKCGLKALLKKGFNRHETHHTMLCLVVEGKKTSIRTRISHGQSKADDWLLRKIAKQLHLS